MSSIQNNSLDGRPTDGVHSTRQAASHRQRRPPNKKGLRSSKLWICVWLAFALQITAWVFWVKLASKHPVQEVPLVTAQPTPAPTPAETLSLGGAASERPAQNNNADELATRVRQ